MGDVVNVVENLFGIGDDVSRGVKGYQESKDARKDADRQAKARQASLLTEAMGDRPEAPRRRPAESPVASLLQGEAGQPSGAAPMITTRAPAKKPTLLGKTSLLGYP